MVEGIFLQLAVEREFRKFSEWREKLLEQRADLNHSLACLHLSLRRPDASPGLKQSPACFYTTRHGASGEFQRVEICIADATDFTDGADILFTRAIRGSSSNPPDLF